MEPVTSPNKKLRSPGQDGINFKTSVTCTNVPEGLFDATAAKKHFSKFGRVQKIRLFPKRQMCIIEYDQPTSAGRAVLNAGAYDGFMFDVSSTKPRVRRRSKKDDDPDWVPDSDVEEELSAMRGAPSYRITRQKPMDVESDGTKVKSLTRIVKQSPVRKKALTSTREKQIVASQPTSGIESPVLPMATQTSLSTSEAAAELHQLRSRVSLTPDEQWRTLDARDRILRAWGGAGARVKAGGATIGTCADMCPEKERLHRQAEYQVMTLESVPDSDGQLEPARAVKQYSRSSADQEIPMCYELRPSSVLMRTCAYLLHEIADTTRPVSLADWFHFMWDRLRSIRKDITQQALCCSESIRLVEMCARFHAHCAARLADLEHTQFDQKLNTDNLTKCLQTLKHMYADVDPRHRPREAEFRGYIALLNLGDANFWWEIKQLPEQIQKSEAITFAIQIFNALDNNNYVRFFRLVKEKATYLQACILLRYFNDVRARALARIVKAYAPRGGSRYPAEDLMSALAFESVESMKSFINHYGLRFTKIDDSELTVILDRNQFIEDSDPYPMSRALKLIESKHQRTVGEVIAGGNLPQDEFRNHILYSSFNKDGTLKEAALIAEEQGYNTINDSNQDVQVLKAEVQRLSQSGKNHGITERVTEPRTNLFVKPGPIMLTPGKVIKSLPSTSETKLFSFKPAIPVASTEVIENSPETLFGKTKNIFSFSKPAEFTGSTLFADKGKLFNTTTGKGLFDSKSVKDDKNLFAKTNSDNKDLFQSSKNIFGATKEQEDNIFKKPEVAKSVFGQVNIDQNKINEGVNVFGQNKSIFVKPDEGNVFGNQNTFSNNNIFSKKNDNSFSKPESRSQLEQVNIFSKFPVSKDDVKPPSNIFGKVNVTKTENTVADNILKSVFASNGENTTNKISPSSLFKSVCNPPNGSDTKIYSIFQSKNKPATVVDTFNAQNTRENESVYEFDQDDLNTQKNLELKLIEERKKEEERIREEELRKEEERKQRQEEERRIEEARRKQEELRRLEEKRKKEEERKREELQKKLEEDKKAELKRKAEEERRFREFVNEKSINVTEEVVDEIIEETVKDVMKDEVQKLENLMSYASVVTNETITELCNEICYSEMKAEKFWTEKLMKKWFHMWRKQFVRNLKRRSLLEDTPVWLTEKNPLEEASQLRRLVENAALKNMNAIHRGYKFTGELKLYPAPEPYNIMEIIKSPLLKRMKQISYPYDKCFFWKVTLISPGTMKWMCKKIEIEKWLLDVFSDKKKHETSDSLIYVGKLSWNQLMDFAISVSLTNKEKVRNCGEAVEGSNALMFYITEHDQNFIETLELTLKNKYPYQVIPVAIVMPKLGNSVHNALEQALSSCIKSNIISAFRIFFVDSQNISDSLNVCTKSALKWLAKKFPQCPPLETDYLKSVCQRYLGNEIWYRLKSERDSRMDTVLKDLQRLVHCYNATVDKLTEVITNEDLFNYPSFPLEFKVYLDDKSPYPKPYEFILSNSKTSENISIIKDVMKQLKLPNPVSEFHPMNVTSMQDQIRKYCNQIGWFEDPEQVVCKVVAVLPNELTDINMPCDEFCEYFQHYDLIDFLNIIVYEKINRLNNFYNRYVIYKKSVLEDYRNMHWLYEIDVLSKMKHKPLEDEDDLDMLIEAKRRKIALESFEYLMLEDKDCTMVEDNIKATDESISMYSGCSKVIVQLEEQLEEERKKSIALENLLRNALSDA